MPHAYHCFTVNTTERMRPIKFRAWDTYDNRWRYFTIGESFGQLGESVYRSLRLEGATFQQFTGLKDKLGKEIYEGDIMKHPIEKRWFPWVIEFHGASFCLVNIGIDGYRHEPMYLTEDRVSEREIIGNIYEHSHLLK